MTMLDLASASGGAALPPDLLTAAGPFAQARILAVDIGAHGAAALLDEAGALLDVVDLPTLDAGPACRPEISAALFAAIVRRWAPARAWVERALATPFDDPTVVVTHHAPSARSLSDQHQPSSLDPCYASDLDALVTGSGAALWIHGHTHHCCDHRLGGTRVVNNGHGYGRENRGTYDPALVIEVARDPTATGEAAVIRRSTVP